MCVWMSVGMRGFVAGPVYVRVAERGHARLCGGARVWL